MELTKQFPTTNLHMKLLQSVMTFNSVCFVKSQLTKESSVFKHNYCLLQPVLEFLISKELLISVPNGVISGKNRCVLYIKVVQDESESTTMKNFVSQKLSLIELNWENYIKTCTEIVSCSRSSTFSSEAQRHLNALTHLRLTRRITITSRNNSISTNKKKKNNNKSQTNTLLKYFPVVSASSCVSSLTKTSSSLAIKILPVESEKQSKYFK